MIRLKSNAESDVFMSHDNTVWLIGLILSEMEILSVNVIFLYIRILS